MVEKGLKLVEMIEKWSVVGRKFFSVGLKIVGRKLFEMVGKWSSGGRKLAKVLKEWLAWGQKMVKNWTISSRFLLVSSGKLHVGFRPVFKVGSTNICRLGCQKTVIFYI